MSKAQIWSIDLMAGVTVFLIVIVVYFVFVNNITTNETDDYKDLYQEGIILSDSLILSSVSNHTDIRQVQITTPEYRLNESKLSNISNLSYSSLKLLLKTKYDYLIFFQNRSSEVQNISGIKYIGKSGVTKDNIESVENPQNIVSLKRFVIYDKEIITMVIYLWE